VTPGRQRGNWNGGRHNSANFTAIGVNHVAVWEVAPPEERVGEHGSVERENRRLVLGAYLQVCGRIVAFFGDRAARGLTATTR